MEKKVVLGALLSFVVFLLCFRSAFFDVENEAQKRVIDSLFAFGGGKDLSKMGFSDVEVEHLVEVKKWVSVGRLFLLASLSVFCFGIAFVDVRKVFFYSGVFGLCVFVLLGASLLLFDWSFVLMHKILFRTQWMFPEGSLLVKVFQYNFFVEKAKEIFFRFGLFVGLCFCSIFLLQRGFVARRIENRRH